MYCSDQDLHLVSKPVYTTTAVRQKCLIVEQKRFLLAPIIEGSKTGGRWGQCNIAGPSQAAQGPLHRRGQVMSVFTEWFGRAVAVEVYMKIKIAWLMGWPLEMGGDHICLGQY